MHGRLLCQWVVHYKSIRSSCMPPQGRHPSVSSSNYDGTCRALWWCSFKITWVPMHTLQNSTPGGLKESAITWVYMEQNCYGYRIFTEKYYSFFKHRKQSRGHALPCVDINIFNIAKECFAELWPRSEFYLVCAPTWTNCSLSCLDAEHR